MLKVFFSLKITETDKVNQAMKSQQNWKLKKHKLNKIDVSQNTKHVI